MNFKRLLSHLIPVIFFPGFIGISAAQQQIVQLPQPYATKSTSKFSKVIGWPTGKTPIAPKGFKVTKFAEELENPRWIYVAPNGDVFVSEAGTRKPKTSEKETSKKGSNADFYNSKSQNFGSANKILLFRDSNKDGIYETKHDYLNGLSQPLGMLILNGYFYAANTNGLIRFPYNENDTAIASVGKYILELPAGGYNNHWTRNIITNPAKTKIYISVGSASNVAEHGMDEEYRRAGILEINPDGSGEQIYASGLRNPVGMDWEPQSGNLWTAVNERDGLGDDLVPDYATSVQKGGFYGWPYSYFGAHEDPRLKGERPDLVKKAIVPDVPLGAHTASLGLAFYQNKQFPVKYQGGMFIGQHGSWNRSVLSGYKVIFVPFKNGKPAGPPEDFLTGFIVNAENANEKNANSENSEVFGRPVCIAILPDGSLLVSDDAARVIWKITYAPE